MSEANESPTGNGVNGTPSPQEGAAAPLPTPDRALANMRAAGRAAFLESLKNGESSAETEKPTTPAASESPDPTESDADADDTEADDTDLDTEPTDTEQEAEEEPAGPAAAEGAEEPDADLSKRLEAVQKAKKRALDEVTAAKAELNSEVARHRQAIEQEYGSRIKAAESFEKLKARAKVDLVAVVRSLGIDGDDLDFGARQLHTEWKAWKGDPAAKDQSAAVIRRREYESKLEETQRELQELRDSITKRDEAQQAKAYADQYMGRVEKAIGVKAPIVRSMMAKNAEKTRARLGQVAYDLASETGEEPSPAEVVSALEKIRREELEELGIDPAAVAKAPAKPAVEPAVAAKPAGKPVAKPAAKTEAPATPSNGLSIRASREAARQAFMKGGSQ